MWVFRAALLALCLIPFLEKWLAKGLGIAAFFAFPCIAAICVVRASLKFDLSQAEVEGEDEEDIEEPDFVGGFFWRFFGENLLYLVVLGILFSVFGGRRYFDDFLLVGLIFYPILLALTLSSCNIGVLASARHKRKSSAIFSATWMTVVMVLALGFTVYQLSRETYLSWIVSLGTFALAVGSRVVAKSYNKKRVGGTFPLTTVAVFLIVWSSVMWGVTNNSIRHRNGQLTVCKSHLKNLGTAMEMYSTDWQGKYPEILQQLTPNYLKVLPNCPGAGKMSYQLETGLDATGNEAGFLDFYFLKCQGLNHSVHDVPRDYPQYDGVNGLIER